MTVSTNYDGHCCVCECCMIHPPFAFGCPDHNDGGELAAEIFDRVAEDIIKVLSAGEKE